jgi:hypothetical protein
MTVGHLDAMTLRERIDRAADVLRGDDESSVRAHFADLLGQRGRAEASLIWAEAVRSVEAERPCDPPTRCAPDCIGYCAESYLDEQCEPCRALERARHPSGAAASVPYTCGCGAVIEGDQHQAIFDHIGRCR